MIISSVSDAKESTNESSDWGSNKTVDASKAIINKSTKGEKFVVSKDNSNIKQRLVRFYQIYNPEKLNDDHAIDELLKRYQGRENQLFADLETKYILSVPKTVVKRFVLLFCVFMFESLT